MKKRIWTICVMGLLTGCGAASLQELQSNPIAKDEFDVPIDYGSAYARIAYAARDCYQSAGPAASWLVDADLQPNLHRGDVTITLTNFGKRYYGAIQVVPKDPSSAHVTVLTALDSLQHLGPETERWASGDLHCTKKPAS